MVFVKGLELEFVFRRDEILFSLLYYMHRIAIMVKSVFVPPPSPPLADPLSEFYPPTCTAHHQNCKCNITASPKKK